MTSGVIADSIVNLCGAIGLTVAMVTLHRRDARNPLTRRLLPALGVIATLFFVRGAAWWSGNALLDRISLIPAALIPFGALIVTEGILRRHAPRQVKIVIVLGGIGLSGGRGGIRNVIVGTLLIGILLNGMTIMNIQYTLQNVIRSSILLAAIVLDSIINPRDEQTSQQGDI